MGEFIRGMLWTVAFIAAFYAWGLAFYVTMLWAR